MRRTRRSGMKRAQQNKRNVRFKYEFIMTQIGIYNLHHNFLNVCIIEERLAGTSFTILQNAAVGALESSNWRIEKGECRMENEEWRQLPANDYRAPTLFNRKLLPLKSTSFESLFL